MDEGRATPNVWERRVAERLVAGDEAALVEVFDHYGPYVFGLAQRIAANAGLAEEITQEVFVHLWQHADRVDFGVGTVRSYLGVLTHRRSVDLVRSEQARRTREAREVARAPLAPADLAEAAHAIAEAAVVRRALDTLPSEQRAVIVHVYLDGTSYRDTAITLGIPEGTAKSRGRLGLRRLAAELEAQGVVSGN